MDIETLDLLIKEKEEAREEGMKEMFTKIRQVLRGEAVVFPYALDANEINWLYEQARTQTPFHSERW